MRLLHAAGRGAMVAALAGGCALAKPPEQAAVVDSALPAATTIPATWRAPADSDSVSGGWLATFQDPGLTAVVEEAVLANPDLQVAAARMDAVRQSVGVVSARLKPSLGATLGASVVKDQDQASSYDANQGLVTASWELDIWGKVRAQKASAVAASDAAALQYAWARQSLAALAARTWYLAIETRQLVALDRRAVSIYAELLNLVQLRRAAGKVSDLDVAEATANLQAAQGQLLAAQSNDAEARRALELLLGRYPSAELVAADSFVPLPPPVASGIPADLLARRPDVASQEQQVLAAFRTEEAARLALLPSLSLQLSAGRLSDALLSLVQLNPWMAAGAIGMSIPIYAGGGLRAQVRVANAQQAAEVAAYGSVVLRAFAEVERALTDEQILGERLTVARAELASRTDAVRIARIKYLSGGIDLLSVLQLQTEQLLAEATVIQLERARLAMRIDLHLALGGDFGG